MPLRHLISFVHWTLPFCPLWFGLPQNHFSSFQTNRFPRLAPQSWILHPGSFCLLTIFNRKLKRSRSFWQEKLFFSGFQLSTCMCWGVGHVTRRSPWRKRIGGLGIYTNWMILFFNCELDCFLVLFPKGICQKTRGL